MNIHLCNNYNMILFLNVIIYTIVLKAYLELSLCTDSFVNCPEGVSQGLMWVLITPSQMCGSWCRPPSLFRDGL